MMRFTQLKEWLEWLESGSNARIELGLERVQAVFDRLGGAAPSWSLITVAGTNGKGSCVALLEAILRAAGYTVGAYTSPHLLRYNERVSVNGKALSDDALCHAFARIDQARDDTPLTYFEFGTLAAIDHFMRVPPDVVILEVGLGGRLDACNILSADIALVSRIGLDHQSWLGEDREAIGREKAGIFRAGRLAVCGDPEPPASIANEARSVGARLYQIGEDFHYRATPPGWEWRCATRRRSALPFPSLLGSHQIQNAAAVLMVLELLADRLPVGQGAVRQGLMEVRLAGRCQVLPGTVETILDVAHNPQAAGIVAELLQRRPCEGKTHLVLGMLEDKDTEGFVRNLREQVAAWYVGGIAAPRGLDANALAARLRAVGIEPDSVADDVGAAYEAASDRASRGDRIVVCGSFYAVAAVLATNQAD